ncbi:MAG: fluoride efflux transporter FluC [Candidatus Kariarchaeaceae archaeon]|jgi:CrcB protein
MLEKIPNLALVGFGGILGTMTRYLLSIMINHERFPLSTFIVNVLGSFLLGFLMTMHESDRLSQDWALLLGVGYMGSLTTMSTFAVDTISSGSFQLGSLNIILTLTFVLVGAILGRFTALFVLN